MAYEKHGEEYELLCKFQDARVAGGEKRKKEVAFLSPNVMGRLGRRVLDASLENARLRRVDSAAPLRASNGRGSRRRRRRDGVAGTT